MFLALGLQGRCLPVLRLCLPPLLSFTATLLLLKRYQYCCVGSSSPGWPSFLSGVALDSFPPTLCVGGFSKLCIGKGNRSQPDL